MTNWTPVQAEERYRFEPNPEGIHEAALRLTPTSCCLTISDDRGEHRLEFGINSWQAGRTTFWPGGEEPFLAKAGMQDDGKLSLTVVLIEGGFQWDVRIDRLSGTLTLVLMPPVFDGGRELLAHRLSNHSAHI